MYVIDKYNPIINIELENGIYEFCSESGTGKTRLCRILKELQKLGEPVIGYTYGDDILGIDLKDLVSKVNPKVILLDRYHMYNGTFSKEIIEWSKNTIILIDCKSILDINYDTDLCIIEMLSNRINVTH